MSRFKSQKKREVPTIGSGSLPDIIFMLLFFFMVTTTMRDATVMVKINAPGATEVQKLAKKALVSYIYIGPPTERKLGSDVRIQLNDAFATVNDIKEFILKEKEQRDPVDRPFMTTSFKVNNDTRMGIVTDIKQELREVGAFKINYSTRKVPKMEF